MMRGAVLLLCACGPLMMKVPDAVLPDAAVKDAGTPLDAGADAGPFDAGVELSPFDVWRVREPIYELYPRHFSAEGNFAGVQAKLPELKALGVGIVWLLPVNEIGSIVPANGGAATDAPWGNPYAVKSYANVNPEYGTEADLRSLVDAAHALDMRVVARLGAEPHRMGQRMGDRALRLVRASERRDSGGAGLSLGRPARLVER